VYNCLDRWVAAGRGQQPCFLFEGNDVGQERVMTYQVGVYSLHADTRYKVTDPSSMRQERVVAYQVRC
jgi:acyl-coenzyme A synthetase/AMP-(fatty) acid ligase